MNILDDKYINNEQRTIENQIREVAGKLSEMLESQASDANMSVNQISLVQELTKFKYILQIYSKCEEMINENQSKINIVNTFKISLNTERYNLKEIDLNSKQKQDHKLDSLSINKKIEVEALEEFMEKEIYCFL